LSSTFQISSSRRAQFFSINASQRKKKKKRKRKRGTIQKIEIDRSTFMFICGMANQTTTYAITKDVENISSILISCFIA